MTSGRATMQHVAALAGVSLKTVSRVINDESGVSPELRERVREAVARLGYRYNLPASNLRRGRRTASIGVLVQDLGNDFCGDLLRAIEDRARTRGIVVMSSSLDEEPARERDLVTGLIARRIDGLILMPATSDQSYLVPEMQAGLVVVVVDRPPRGVHVDAVMVDNRRGSADATRHLLAHGHRRIAFIGDSPDIATAPERAAGYRQALAEHGVAPDTALEQMGARASEEAERAVLSLLALPDPPAAILAARNVLTVGTVRALQRLGRSRQVALVGFDDFPTADLLDPGVTTVRQPVATQGALAIDILVARLNGDTGEVRREVVETELICRGSGEIEPLAAS
ncbi:MAG: LacI family DNA-binding transcriptional regulator [Nocardioides sp.]